MINRFIGKYYFLSNFCECKIEYKGLIYNSVEAAFQAQKCPDRSEEFTHLDPKQAKKLGREVKLRDDWEVVKLGIMKNLLWRKFYKGEFKKKLIETQTEEIIEGNSWGDRFWGLCIEKGNYPKGEQFPEEKIREGVGENHMGKLLMEIRSKLIDPNTNIYLEAMTDHSVPTHIISTMEELNTYKEKYKSGHIKFEGEALEYIQNEFIKSFEKLKEEHRQYLADQAKGWSKIKDLLIL